jgi:hypothetical protein
MGLEPLQIAIAVGLLAAGALIGFLSGRRGGGALARRIRLLETELREERDRSAAYRESVAKHFSGTSDLFRDLTREYAALYAHLAEGARDLSGGAVPEIGRGYADPSLRIGAGAADPEPSRPPASEKLAAPVEADESPVETDEAPVDAGEAAAEGEAEAPPAEDERRETA